MKIFKKIYFKNLILVMAILYILFNSIFPSFVYADQDESSEDEWWTGTLFTPLGELFAGAGDTIINILQGYMLPSSPTAVEYRKKADIDELTLYKISADDIDINKSPIPKIYYSAGAIFSNTIPAFDVNFINPKVENRFTNDKTGNIAEGLKGVISKWYIALRTIAIVGLLIVLVYIGIRIMISSTSDETAKYKESLRQWITGIVMVICMHYLIIFILSLNEVIIDALKNAVLSDSGMDVLMNQARMDVSAAKSMLEKIGHIIIYFVLVLYTCRFTIRYIERVIYMAFLTLISPLVALTFPLDKISSGRSPAFDMWFKEFLFNLLLQPIHLLLYAVFVSSAIELATSNMLYGMIAIGFISQAEGFIKKMFGIAPEGGLGKKAKGFAAGSLFASGLKLLRTGANKATGLVSKGNNEDGGSKTRMVDKPSTDDNDNNDRNTDLSSFDNNEQRHEDTDEGHEDTDEGHEDTDEGHENTDEGHENTDEGHENTDEGHEDTDEGHEDTDEGHEDTDEGHEDTAGENENSNEESNSSEEVDNNENPETAEQRKAREKRANKWKRRYGGLAVAKKFKGPALKALRILPKAALAATGAVALGSIGVAAGLAGDDFNDVLKYGAAGIGAGAFIGNEAEKQLAGMGKRTLRAPQAVRDLKDKYDQGAMTEEEYKNKIRTQENKETMKNLEKDFRKQGLSKEEIKTQKEKAQALFDAGLTGDKNIKDGIKLIDMQKQGRTAQGNTIKQVTDLDKGAKRAAGAINAQMTVKDITKGNLDKYAAQKVKGKSGQEEFKDLVKAYNGMK